MLSSLGVGVWEAMRKADAYRAWHAADIEREVREGRLYL
jgi:hypothetical protein